MSGIFTYLLFSITKIHCYKVTKHSIDLYQVDCYSHIYHTIVIVIMKIEPNGSLIFKCSLNHVVERFLIFHFNFQNSNLSQTPNWIIFSIRK